VSTARDVTIRDDSIGLGQFLKLADLIDNGADAKPLLAGERERRGGDPSWAPARQG
jgi:ribosome-associated protein